MPRDGRTLTSRQLEVLELLARGLTNPEIASVLSIRPSTVKTHVTAVLDALGVSNRTEAATSLQELKLDGLAPGSEPVPGFGQRPSVAVLPFDDAELPEAERHLAAGLLADLTQRMGEVRWFPVIDREAAVFSRQRPDDAGELEARYLVEGSLRREGNGLLVTAQLWDAVAGELIWTEQFRQPLATLATGDAEFVERLMGALEPVVQRTERIRAARAHAEQIAVWDYCKRADFALASERADAYRNAVALYQKALSVDDGSLQGWTGLALAEAAALYLGFAEDRAATGARALEAAQRAAEICPASFEAHYGRGRALAMMREDDASIEPLEAAIDTNPSSVAALNTLAGALRRVGRNEDALPVYHRGLRLSPVGVTAYHLHGGIAMAHLALEQFDESLAAARRAVTGDAERGETRALDFYGIIPASLALLGRIEEARDAWAQRPTERPAMRHTAHYVGPEAAILVDGLRRAGWDGSL